MASRTRAAGKLTKSSAGGAAVVFSPRFTSTDVCTEIMGVRVKLGRRGRPGELAIRATAIGTSKRQRDVDQIRLICRR
ncbi:MAG: hypothetical protein E6J75_18270 [Deltaproteobacteria bacterium]|nr:MAG: hypothetical protein E6J79_00905 [Deltaproteobacteria bacterium]TMA51537.1 MAG: hypothetical protein E6J75_18270 [Deltaproteobacteria bacterium]